MVITRAMREKRTTEFFWLASQNKNNGVTSEEPLGDVAILGERLCLFLALPSLVQLRSHLLYVLEHRVAVTIESLHATEQLFVVTAVDENLNKQSSTWWRKDNTKILMMSDWGETTQRENEKSLSIFAPEHFSWWSWSEWGSSDDEILLLCLL